MRVYTPCGFCSQPLFTQGYIADCFRLLRPCAVAPVSSSPARSLRRRWWHRSAQTESTLIETRPQAPAAQLTSVRSMQSTRSRSSAAPGTLLFERRSTKHRSTDAAFVVLKSLSYANPSYVRPLCRIRPTPQLSDWPSLAHLRRTVDTVDGVAL